jgi:hypothetical protein
MRQRKKVKEERERKPQQQHRTSKYNSDLLCKKALAIACQPDNEIEFESIFHGERNRVMKSQVESVE